MNERRHLVHEVVHALQRLGDGRGAKVERHLRHAHGLVGANVLGDLGRLAGKQQTVVPPGYPPRILGRGFEGDRQRFVVAPLSVGKTLQLVQQNLKLGRRQRRCRGCANGLPAVAEPGDAAQ